uniref:F-box domain-containing protein n=1 Tax=Schizophyllum commune (strain H4-8 / FGSC 9210) TaxID=578458 RepID=D8PY38_SCHCM
MSTTQRIAETMRLCPMLRLSLSLMQDILRHLESSRDILAVCLCSSHLYESGKTILYEAPAPTNAKNTRKLLQTLIDKPELALGVDRLIINPFSSTAGSFPDLCADAIRLTRNLTELNLTALPTIPSLLGTHVLPQLATCCLVNTASAAPFLKANAETITSLLLVDIDDEQGLDQKITFPKLDVADVSLAVAPYVLPGSLATRVRLSVTSNLEKRPAELTHFASLAGLSITDLKVTSERLKSDIIIPIARYASRELQWLNFETIRPHTKAQRKRFFDTLEIHIALMRKLANLVFTLRAGVPRRPDNNDLDEMSGVCQRLYKRCPTLERMIPGLNVMWQPYDGVWFPLVPKEEYDEWLDLIGMWTARRLMKDDKNSIWGAMMRSLWEDPVGVREFEESRGVKVANPKNVPRKYGGEADDPEDGHQPMEAIQTGRIVEDTARGLTTERYASYVLYVRHLQIILLLGVDPRFQHIQPQPDGSARLVRVRDDGQVLQLRQDHPLRLARAHRHGRQQRRVVHRVPVLQSERRQPRELRHIAEEGEHFVECPKRMSSAVDALLVVTGYVEIDHGREDEVVDQVARVALHALGDHAKANHLHLVVRDLPVRRVYGIALGRLPAQVHAQHVRHRRHDAENVRRVDIIRLEEADLRPREREAEVERRTVERQGLEVRCNLEDAAHGACVADARRDEVQGAQEGKPPANGAEMVEVDGVHEEERVAPAIAAANNALHDELLAVAFAEDKEGDGE